MKKYKVAVKGSVKEMEKEENGNSYFCGMEWVNPLLLIKSE